MNLEKAGTPSELSRRFVKESLNLHSNYDSYQIVPQVPRNPWWLKHSFDDTCICPMVWIRTLIACKGRNMVCAFMAGPLAFRDTRYL